MPIPAENATCIGVSLRQPTVAKDQTMKPKLFTLSAAMILLTSATSIAGNGYFTELGRGFGYGYGDGYHAQRYCLNADSSCGNCSPVQQPMIHHSKDQQPKIQEALIPRPMPASAYSQRVPPQFQQVGYPAGYPVAPAYQPRYQPSPPGYGHPVMPPVASPHRNPVSPW